MGFNTSVLLLNDAFRTLERHPEEAVSGIIAASNDGGTVGVGNHANPITVLPSQHADVTQLIAVGKNSAAVVFLGWQHTPSHHTKEGREALLRQWARSEGFDLRRRPDRR